MKITYSAEKINPFGGINFVNKTIENTGIFQLIDNELGKRPAQAEYSNSDVFKALHFLLEYISTKVDFVKTTFRFVVVTTKWIRQSRQDILKVFLNKEYHLITQ